MRNATSAAISVNLKNGNMDAEGGHDARDKAPPCPPFPPRSNSRRFSSFNNCRVSMTLRQLASLLTALCLSGAATAETLPPVPGSEDAAYKTAVADWLGGQDTTALRALSDLAGGGNTAAQILLGRISENAAFYKHLSATMPRKERIALMRQPGGLSGRSWLLAAEGSEPLAAALLQAAQPDKRADAIAPLLDLGELSTAMRTGLDMLYYGEAEPLLMAISGRTDLPREAMFLGVAALDFIVPGAFSDATQGLAAHPELPVDVTLTWVAPSPANLSQDKAMRDLVAETAPQVRAWTPLVAFCDRHCPDSPGTCAALGAALAPKGPFPFESPSQRLIPDEVYWSSARMEGDLARGYMDLSNPDKKAELTRIDACFLPAMASAQKAALQ